MSPFITFKHQTVQCKQIKQEVQPDSPAAPHTDLARVFQETAAKPGRLEVYLVDDVRTTTATIILVLAAYTQQSHSILSVFAMDHPLAFQ